MDQSPLQTLPAEMRNNIYEPVLWQPGPVKVSIIQEKPRLARSVFDTNTIKKPVIVGLPATCKELRQECLQLYLSVNHFRFRTMHFDRHREAGSWMTTLMDWRSMIGLDQAKQIRHVTIDLGTWTCAADGHYKPRIQRNPRLLCLRYVFHSRADVQLCMIANCWRDSLEPFPVRFSANDPGQAFTWVRRATEQFLDEMELSIDDGTGNVGDDIELDWTGRPEVFFMAQKILKKLLIKINE